MTGQLTGLMTGMAVVRLETVPVVSWDHTVINLVNELLVADNKSVVTSQ